jgi:hypothetical protein
MQGYLDPPTGVHGPRNGNLSVKNAICTPPPALVSTLDRGKNHLRL